MSKLERDIYKAFSEIVNQRNTDIAVKQHDFREYFFEETLERIVLIEKQQKKKKTVKLLGRSVSRIAVLIILLILSFGLICYAMYKAGFLYELFEKYTEVTIDETTVDLMRDRIEQVYTPGYVPEGYVEFNSDTSDYVNLKIFMSQEGGELHLIQQVGDTTYSYDSEETEPYYIDLPHSTGYYFLKNGESTLTWYFDGYLFELVSLNDIGQDELKKIAESLTVH